MWAVNSLSRWDIPLYVCTINLSIYLLMELWLLLVTMDIVWRYTCLNLPFWFFLVSIHRNRNVKFYAKSMFKFSPPNHSAFTSDDCNGGHFPSLVLVTLVDAVGISMRCFTVFSGFTFQWFCFFAGDLLIVLPLIISAFHYTSGLGFWNT